MRIGRYLLIALLLTVTIVAARHRSVRHIFASTPMSAPGATYGDSAFDTHAPEGVRIKVEVLNATKSHGLARRATLYLRDRGFDVVLIGTTRGLQKETLVLDRSNHPAWAHLLARAMRGRVESRPDTLRYLDATVLVGSDWAPPSEPFYP